MIYRNELLTVLGGMEHKLVTRASVDKSVEAAKKNQKERTKRMKQNAYSRDRLVAELTEPILRRMFAENLDYLKKIEAGEVESSRHQAFQKSVRTRHMLFYCMISDPFSDDQLSWTMDEIVKVWMTTKKEQVDRNEYVWKVLLAETFLKLYMDFFKVDKREAEKRIGETPLVGMDEDDNKKL